MLIRFVHRDTGREYTIPASQVVVYDDTYAENPMPVALAYTAVNAILYSDANDQDWAKVCKENQLEPSRLVKHG